MAGFFKNLFVGRTEIKEDDDSSLLTPLTTLSEIRRQQLNDKLRASTGNRKPHVVGSSQPFGTTYLHTGHLPVANYHAQMSPRQEAQQYSTEILPVGYQHRQGSLYRRAENVPATGHAPRYSQSKTHGVFTEHITPPPPARLATSERHAAKYERPRKAPVPGERKPPTPILSNEPFYAISSRYPKSTTSYQASSLSKKQKPLTRADPYPAVRNRNDTWYHENALSRSPSHGRRRQGHRDTQLSQAKRKGLFSFLGFGQSEEAAQRRELEARKVQMDREREQRRIKAETERYSQRGRERDRERWYYTRKAAERKELEDQSRRHWS